MASSNTSTTPSIFLHPTEHTNTINNESTIPSRKITQSNKSDLNELVDSNVNGFVREAKALFTFRPSEWISAFRRNNKYPLFAVGDIDGFVALFMNNLATLLAVILGLKIVFDDDIIYGKIVPG